MPKVSALSPADERFIRDRALEAALELNGGVSTSYQLINDAVDIYEFLKSGAKVKVPKTIRNPGIGDRRKKVVKVVNHPAQRLQARNRR